MSNRCNKKYTKSSRKGTIAITDVKEDSNYTNKTKICKAQH